MEQENHIQKSMELSNYCIYIYTQVHVHRHDELPEKPNPLTQHFLRHKQDPTSSRPSQKRTKSKQNP